MSVDYAFLNNELDPFHFCIHHFSIPIDLPLALIESPVSLLKNHNKVGIWWDYNLTRNSGLIRRGNINL